MAPSGMILTGCSGQVGYLAGNGQHFVTVTTFSSSLPGTFYLLVIMSICFFVQFSFWFRGGVQIEDKDIPDIHFWSRSGIENGSSLIATASEFTTVCHQLLLNW